MIQQKSSTICAKSLTCPVADVKAQNQNTGQWRDEAPIQSTDPVKGAEPVVSAPNTVTASIHRKEALNATLC